MSLINLVWSGATDLENAIIGYELSYKTGTTWIQLPFISTTNGYGSYSFMATQNITHTFRIRTKDAAQNYSPYKTLVVPFIQTFYISQTSTPPFVGTDACSLATPDVTIYPASPVLATGSVVYLDSAQSNPLDGTLLSIGGASSFIIRQWKILTPQQENYSVRIDNQGVIQGFIICNNNVYNGLLSNSTSSGEQACNLNVLSTNTVYWSQENFAVGTILYTDSSMTTTIGAGFYRIYHVLNELERDCIIKVSTAGAILTLNNYTPYCTNSNPTNPSTGNNCVDPDTLILMEDDIYMLAGDIEVGDIVYTMHETQKVYGFYKVLFKDIVKENKLKIGFDDNTSIIVSYSHKFLNDNGWIEASLLSPSDFIKGYKSDKYITSIDDFGVGDVVRLQIDHAHTYIANDLISHNKTIIVNPNSP